MRSKASQRANGSRSGDRCVLLDLAKDLHQSLAELVGRELTVAADDRFFKVVLRVDTPGEAGYLWHGGILPFVVRALAGV